MNEERELIRRRLFDLWRKSESGGYFVFSGFLGLAELSVLAECPRELRDSCSLFGGHEGCERKMARFGSPTELGYEEEFPIAVLRAEPRQQKYADRLTHRDFLGAILNTGLERDVIGDIAIIDNVGYIFVSRDIAEYLTSSLTRVKHTDLSVTVAEELPEGELYRTEKRQIQVSGERLDAVIARVFNLSRDEAQGCFKRRQVYVNGMLVESVSHTPRVGDVVSVRTRGRFIYHGYMSDTRKGKLNLLVEVYV